MSNQLPTDSHNFVLWLFENLTNTSSVAGTALWEGLLPDEFNFEEVTCHLDSLLNDRLAGTHDETKRTIGFYPSRAGVYEDIDALLKHATNLEKVPSHFTLRDLNFSYPSSVQSEWYPLLVRYYLDAISLFSVLRNLADVNNGGIMFVQSHEAQLIIISQFDSDDLRPLDSLSIFMTEFSNIESHSDQKRSIIRSVLIDQFKPKKTVTMADVLSKFEEIATDARHSLAMYMSEFSVAKVKSEVERQNLDDSLSLNKTLSDIQNQLLALPAAILLAVASIKTGEIFRNYILLFSISIFTIFMLILISNQRNSVHSISEQIYRRKSAVSSMPSDSSKSIKPLFDTLTKRIESQEYTLLFIQYIVINIFIITAFSVIYVSHTEVLKAAYRFFVCFF